MIEKNKEISENLKNMSQNTRSHFQNEEGGWKDGWVSPPPPGGRRTLKFPDDTQVGVNGLDDIMAELHAEGSATTYETAKEIINRLEAKQNHIPSSERARKEYAYVLLKEYRAYISDKGR